MPETNYDLPGLIKTPEYQEVYGEYVRAAHKMKVAYDKYIQLLVDSGVPPQHYEKSKVIYGNCKD